ncbi:12761_t:CDS:2, partial [Acaulospora colombiana]
GITDIEGTIKELLLTLKPGGFLIIIDGDRFMETDQTKVMAVAKVEGDEIDSSSSENGSWLARIAYEASTANAISGADIVKACDVIDLGLWDHPLCDPETAGGGSLYIPIDPNNISSQRLQLAGLLLQKTFLSSHLAWHPILLKHGMKEHVLTEWSRNIDYGLSDLEIFHEGSKLEESLNLPYPAVYPYKDRDHALAEMNRRKDILAKFPKAVVAKCWEEQKRTDIKE